MQQALADLLTEAWAGLSVRRHDADHDGKLSESELHQLLKDLGLSLRRPEVRQLVLFCGAHSCPPTLPNAASDTSAWLCADKDGSGAVSTDELRWLLTEAPSSHTAQHRFADAPDLREWLQKEFEEDESCVDGRCVSCCMSFMPLVRIGTIFLLTALLISTCKPAA